ncbi:MAG: GH3 auxin-responsive promoter family protein [Bacillota bacterium]|nr:GH3 auxin-responsive promoter family protein [Bacillota bacterium]
MRYLYLRFALVCEDIVHAVSMYDDYILGVVRYLEQNWQMLCDEIEQGTYQFTPIDASDSEWLAPNPKRAQVLREILKDGLKPDSIHRIWPLLQLVSGASKIGTFVQYENLEHYLEGIERDNSPYGATEAMMGIAPGINDKRIVLLPHICFFEFIPLSQVDEEHPQTLTMSELSDGETYELVITTQAGLYRYRIGDLLKVVGRKEGCPLFQFEGRKGIGIDLTSEKSPESALRNALIVAALRSKVSLKASCMYGEGERFREDGTSTLRYVVQFEAKKELSEEELEDFAKEIDKQICNVIKTYAEVRKNNVIQPLKVEQVPIGSFSTFEEKARKMSSNPLQYKRPFIMKLEI